MKTIKDTFRPVPPGTMRIITNDKGGRKAVYQTTSKIECVILAHLLLGLIVPKRGVRIAKTKPAAQSEANVSQETQATA